MARATTLHVRVPQSLRRLSACPPKLQACPLSGHRKRVRTLDERLLNDAGSGDVLPLIEFTLQQLFQARQMVDEKPCLTIAAYDALGGLDGAIDRTGEDALKSINVVGFDALAMLFRHLVGTTQSDDTMGTARWQLSVRSAALTEFTPGSQAREIVDALVAARLLTTSEEGGVPAVRLAHQRVLQAWSRARAAVAANTDYYRVVSEIRQQCRRWQDSNGKPSLFLPKDILSQVRGHAQRFGNFDPLLTDFIAASRWRQHIFRFRHMDRGGADSYFASYFLGLDNDYDSNRTLDQGKRYSRGIWNPRCNVFFVTSRACCDSATIPFTSEIAYSKTKNAGKFG